ncbi:H-2 class II histocompatibility antigen, A-U alpha chain-like isoform X4 [Sebastes umbrosus]|uniref:H-2 class II histocompatibility antigen, A-U alpha chain-like isoform X4 n=1 Tax=Sebastes umbrosus TaxID=72105 RepID=UPI00189D9B96|nr:H-2 class II histocompatibility antigen, A-U alpha chain-like isoform X4 [Sebastes umbrosus]
MKLMKMIVVLVLSGVLCVSAEGLHQDIHILGCSEVDGEFMYGLDGEELWYADFKNNRGVDPQPSFVDHMSYPEGVLESAKASLQICRTNLQNHRGGFKDLPQEKDAPSSPMIYTHDNVDLGQENILICHVTGFFPAPVNVSWTKNGEKVTVGTTINVPMINKDGTYNQFSTLKFTPQLGDIYSCEVEHLALEQPLTRIWDVEVELNVSVSRCGGEAECFCLQMWRCGEASARYWPISVLWTGSDGGSARCGCWNLLPHQRKRVQLIGWS